MKTQFISASAALLCLFMGSSCSLLKDGPPQAMRKSGPGERAIVIVNDTKTEINVLDIVVQQTTLVPPECQATYRQAWRDSGELHLFVFVLDNECITKFGFVDFPAENREMTASAAVHELQASALLKPPRLALTAAARHQ